MARWDWVRVSLDDKWDANREHLGRERGRDVEIEVKAGYINQATNEFRCSEIEKCCGVTGMVEWTKITGAFKMLYGLTEISIIMRPVVSSQNIMTSTRD
jgi:hypothetical protein